MLIKALPCKNRARATAELAFLLSRNINPKRGHACQRFPQFLISISSFLILKKLASPPFLLYNKPVTLSSYNRHIDAVSFI